MNPRQDIVGTLTPDGRLVVGGTEWPVLLDARANVWTEAPNGTLFMLDRNRTQSGTPGEWYFTQAGPRCNRQGLRRPNPPRPEQRRHRSIDD